MEKGEEDSSMAYKPNKQQSTTRESLQQQTIINYENGQQNRKEDTRKSLTNTMSQGV